MGLRDRSQVDLRLGLATCARIPDLEPADRALAAALRRRGVSAEPLVWSSAELTGFDAVVVRSCWDYHLDAAGFSRWIDRVVASGTRLWNPAEVVRWNLDKRYLVELAGRGFSVVPTRVVEPGDRVALADVLEQQGWDRAVVKPAISASAYQTWRCDRVDAVAAQPRFEAIRAGHGALVQPFMPEILRDGEWSLVYLGGEYSHAVRKRPASGDFRVQQSFGGKREPITPSPAVRAAADGLLEAVAGECLYARVDGVVRDGEFFLMELELIDPELYFEAEPRAAERLADAIEAALVRG